VDADAFNRIIWEGMMIGAYPNERSHLNLRSHRQASLH
jgi:hypothetical protein